MSTFGELEQARRQARREELRKDIWAGGSVFHWRDDRYFSRLPDGSVSVKHIREIGQFYPEIVEWIIDPLSWASIVASVSASGETSETYQAALAFHAETTP